MQLEELGHLCPSPFMTIGRSSYPTAKSAILHPSARGLILSCLQLAWKMKSSMWLLCVINEGRLEKNPQDFLSYKLLEKRHAIRSETSQHANSQSIYVKDWNWRFCWPWKKKQIPNWGSEKKLKKSPVSTIFVLALLMNRCSLPVLWFCPVYLLCLHTFCFWAITVSRADLKVGSKRATSSLPSSLSLNFWAWGPAFEQNFCDGDCRD